MSIGARITELREKRGWTQDQVAEKLGIKRARYNSWENDIAKPDVEFTSKLSELFTVSSDYLITGKESSYPEWATKKDVKDFKELLESEQEVMFDGVPLDSEAKQRVKDVLTGLFWEAKKMNKETYGRKKKNDDNK